MSTIEQNVTFERRRILQALYLHRVRKQFERDLAASGGERVKIDPHNDLLLWQSRNKTAKIFSFRMIF